MTSILVPLATYPLAAPDEQFAINRLAVAVATVRYRLSKEFSHDWLKTKLRERLRDGELTICAKAVEAADQCDEMADAALRDSARSYRRISCTGDAWSSRDTCR